uniref:Uncharacterized protein n=1 Tax=Aegilops tauschii subsp. strangulata TaxID=200361 RepID=A0A453QHH0_AEGTS
MRLICFVDFAGYKFDEHDRSSPQLRLQFARFKGPRGQAGGPGGGGGGGGGIRR